MAGEYVWTSPETERSLVATSVVMAEDAEDSADVEEVDSEAAADVAASEVAVEAMVATLREADTMNKWAYGLIEVSWRV
jgi:hypothetical protein